MKTGISTKKPAFDRRLQRLALPFLFVLAAVAVVLTLRFMRQESTLTLKEEVYQYSMFNRVDYQAGTTLLPGKYALSIKTEEETYSGDVTPIYGNVTKSFYPAQDMSWSDPYDGSEWRIPALCKIWRDEKGKIWCEQEKREPVCLEGGIMRGNQGTYVFLDPITMELNGKKIELSPFSFSSMIGDAIVRVYSYEKGEIIKTNDLIGNIVIHAKRGYTVDLTRGFYMGHDGANRLLSANPGYLRDIWER